MKAYVAVSQLGKSYEGAEGSVAVLEDFSLNIGEGEFVTLMGSKGCGKSTVLKIIAGLIPRSTGTIQIGTRKISSPGPDRAIVLPTPCLMPWMSALDNVLLGLEQVHHHGEPSHRRDIAVQCLELVGMGECMEVRTSLLCPEMLQRVSIARAIALKPRVLLLDDPFSSFAATSRSSLQKVLRRVLRQCDVTTLMATQDIDEALLFSDRVALMTHGPRSYVDEIFELPSGQFRNEANSRGQAEYAMFRDRISDFLEQQEPSAATAFEKALETKRTA